VQERVWGTRLSERLLIEESSGKLKSNLREVDYLGYFLDL